jgi:hypothetical protein
MTGLVKGTAAWTDIQKTVERPQRSQAAVDRADSAAILPTASDIGIYAVDLPL